MVISTLLAKKKAPGRVGDQQPSERYEPWYFVRIIGTLRSSTQILADQSPTDKKYLCKVKKISIIFVQIDMDHLLRDLLRPVYGVNGSKMAPLFKAITCCDFDISLEFFICSKDSTLFCADQEFRGLYKNVLVYTFISFVVFLLHNNSWNIVIYIHYNPHILTPASTLYSRTVAPTVVFESPDSITLSDSTGP